MVLSKVSGTLQAAGMIRSDWPNTFSVEDCTVYFFHHSKPVVFQDKESANGPMRSAGLNKPMCEGEDDSPGQNTAAELNARRTAK